MNAVGRIFIVLIFIMSLVFMSFTIAVYSASNNWKNKAAELTKERDDAKKKATESEKRFEDLKISVAEQMTAKGDIIAALHAEKANFQDESKTMESRLAQVDNTNRQAIQAIAVTHKSLNAAQAEQTTLRDDFRKTQLDWNGLMTDFIKKTDEAHDLEMKLANLQAVSKELVKQYANAKAVLDQFGYKPIPELYTGVPPYLVTGRVTEVRATGYVEITIGEDSGLMKGHQLDVYRKSEDGRDVYLGVVEVVLTSPNRAAAKVLPEYRKGTVQTGDIVTSEFSQERQKYQIKRDTHVATTIN